MPVLVTKYLPSYLARLITRNIEDGNGGQVITGLGPQPAQPGAQTFLFGAGGNQGGEGNDEAGEWCAELAIAAGVS
jgi:hypothetical protein